MKRPEILRSSGLALRCREHTIGGRRSRWAAAAGAGEVGAGVGECTASAGVAAGHFQFGGGRTRHDPVGGRRMRGPGALLRSINTYRKIKPS